MKRTIAIAEVAKAFLHLIYPRVCHFCGNVLFERETYLCQLCLSKLPATGFEQYKGNKVEQIFWGRVPLEFGYSAFFFRKRERMQTLIHQVKYHGNQELGILLGREAARLMVRGVSVPAFDLLVPVPLHPKKMRLRGFNQSELIAMGMSEVLHIPVDSTLLQRGVFTETQTRKGRFSRWENVADSFVLSAHADREGFRILLVDDVVTTGATLEACCKTLLEISGVKLGIATLAYAVD